MAKKVELGPAGLGDVSDLMHNKGVSDLSWLDVNEDDYRAAEALPKQNLDIIPELQRALSEDVGDVPQLIPLRSHTVVNTNPLDPPGAPNRNVNAAIKNRTAHYVMRGMGVEEVGKKLLLEFSAPQIKMAMEDIGRVFEERGLLGSVYLDADHFPRCAQGGEAKKFASKVASKAIYVLAKDACSGCIRNSCGSCSVFKKRLVASVPYDERTLAHYAVVLSSEGRTPQIGGDIRLSLRTAFRSPPRQLRADPVRTVHHQRQPQRPEVSADDVSDFVRRKTSASGAELPSPAYMKAALHMMRDGDPAAVAGSSDPAVRRVASDHGIIGHTYVDADALGGCRNTVSFIRSMRDTPRYVIMRSDTCDVCRNASDGACHELEEVATVVSERPGIGRDDFEIAMRAAVARGVIVASHADAIIARAADGSDWASLTSQANLMASRQVEDKKYEGGSVKAFHGRRSDDESVPAIDADAAYREISHLMNTGLHGLNLRKAILARYVVEDLEKIPHVVRNAASRDGVQGSYFIDPTAYPDYGRGCTAGAKRFRKGDVRYVLASSSCTGCTLHTAPGWCSKYAKCLIRRVPTEVMRQAADQRQAEVTQSPVVDPVAQYDLQSPDLPVDLEGSRSDDVSIDMPEKDVTG